MKNQKYKILNLLQAKSYKLKANNGFTLIEVILSMALIAALTAISVPVYNSFQQRSDLDIAVTTIAQNLRRAQLLSQAQERDSSWGVKVTNENITLFKGINFNSRDPNFDEIFKLPPSISANSGSLTEVAYSKLDGMPLPPGTMSLVSSTNEIRNITINSKGTISY